MPSSKASRGSCPRCCCGGSLGSIASWWLDGADRLSAAILEGVCPAALALTAVRLERPTGSPELRAIADRAARSAAEFDSVRATRPASIAAMNTLLTSAYDDRPTRAPITRAWSIVGGAVAWRAEVERASAGRRDIANELLCGE